MTISISNREPASAATGVDPHVRPSFTLLSDDLEQGVDPTSISAWINGTLLVDAGTPVGDSLLVANGNGYDVVLDAGTLPESRSVTVRVVADDTAAASPLDSSWSFTTTHVNGPVITAVEPPQSSIASTSPSEVRFRVTTPACTPALSRALFTARGADLAYSHPTLSGNQILVSRQDFAGDGDTSADLLTTQGAYSFDANDVGKVLLVRGREYRITEQLSPTQVRVHTEFTATELGVDWSLNGHDMTTTEGLWLEVDTGLSAGQRREVSAVHGPAMVSYDGVQLSGASEQFTVYRNQGLDVVIDGLMVIKNGVADADAVTAGWTSTITVLGSGCIDVVVTVPITWPDGKRVDVQVLTCDQSGNVSDINYSFDVVDTRGPQVINVSPAEGKRGLGLNTPDSDISFDVYSLNNINLATLDVEVNGAAAITAGAPVGDYSTSTVTPFTGGYSVVLKRGTAYTDGEVAFVDINVDDGIGYVGERRVLRYHFGATVNDAVVNHGLGGNDVVRALAYDLSQTSFADPAALRHTGYAADGYRYEGGNRTSDVASWFTELGAFPLSGHVVVTAANGWAIVKALDSSAWMTCAPATAPAWSMADNDAGPLTDADFGPDAVLTLAGETVVAVSFVDDRAERYDDSGRVLSAGNITSRDSDQSGGGADTDFALPTGPYTALAAVREQSDGERHAVTAVASSGAMTVVLELGTVLAQALSARDAVTPDPVTTRSFPGTWARVRAAPFSDIGPMVLSYNDAGQGQVEVWDWHRFAAGLASELFIDDATTPAVAAAEARDLSLAWPYVAVAMVGEVDVLDYPESTINAYSEATLGLSGVAGAEMSAVALEPGFRADLGHLYAAVAAAADGRVVRFRVHSPSAGNRSVVVHSGQPFTTLSAIGATVHDRDRYVRTSMDIAT